MIDVLVVGILNTWFAPFIHLFIDLNIEYFLFSSWYNLLMFSIRTSEVYLKIFIPVFNIQCVKKLRREMRKAKLTKGY